MSSPHPCPSFPFLCSPPRPTPSFYFPFCSAPQVCPSPTGTAQSNPTGTFPNGFVAQPFSDLGVPWSAEPQPARGSRCRCRGWVRSAGSLFSHSHLLLSRGMGSHILTCGSACPCRCVYECVPCGSAWPSVPSFTSAKPSEDLFRVQQCLYCESPEVPRESANIGKLIYYEGFYIKTPPRATTK